VRVGVCVDRLYMGFIVYDVSCFIHDENNDLNVTICSMVLVCCFCCLFFYVCVIY